MRSLFETFSEIYRLSNKIIIYGGICEVEKGQLV